MMLRAAIVGCGPRGIEHAQALRSVDGLDLVAVADRAPEAVRPATDALGVPGYLTIEELLERARPDIVVLATPVHGRAALTEQVAAFPGVRAIVAEKPMALTMVEAERMLAVCETRDILLTVSHQWRFSRELVAVKAALDAGEVGAVEFLRGSCYGNLFRQGIHLLDAMRWLSGGREVLWVMSQWSDDPSFLGRHARGDRGYWDDTTHPAPMWMVHHLAFEGGLRATLETGLLYQRSNRFLGDWLQRRVTVIGSEGLAECQTGGHFKLLSTRRAGWTIQEGSIEGYTATTQAFHEEVRDALETGTPHRNDARDALKTFEAVIACAQSAVDGNLTALPLARDRDPLSELEALRQAARTAAAPLQARRSAPAATRTDPPPPQPEVSVIIPLLDHRGLAIESVQSWVRGQTYPRDHYEVIVPTDGSDPALEARVKALLEPQDQMIHHATTNLFLLYNLGARKARGKLLFFTEPHCIAEPDYLQEMTKFLVAHDYDGACSDSVYICPNAMARMAARHFDAGFRTFMAQGDWRKVLLRGFAIYRDSYVQVGGFEPELSYFAEWELAARLHSRGYRLGYASRARVRHRNETTFGETVIFTRGFVRGECAYRMTHPVEYCEQYFGYSEDWASRKFFHPSIARSAVRASWTSLWNEIREGGEWSMVSAQAKAAMHLLPAALLGPRWRLLRDKWVLWMAMARYWQWRFNDQKLYVAYRDVFERMRRCWRIEFINEHLGSSAPVPPEVLHVRPHEVSEEWLVGFHALERWEGEVFRWTGPVALLRLGLPKGAYEVRVETRGVRQAPVPLCLAVFFNRHQVPRSSLRWRDGALAFRLDPSMFAEGPEQRLILTCNPVRPWKVGVPDRRSLGLPIFSIAFRPLGPAAGDRADPASLLQPPMRYSA